MGCGHKHTSNTLLPTSAVAKRIIIPLNGALATHGDFDTESARLMVDYWTAGTEATCIRHITHGLAEDAFSLHIRGGDHTTINHI